MYSGADLYYSISSYSSYFFSICK